MKKLNAYYFSGTGNTRYITHMLCDKLKGSFDTAVFEITEKAAPAQPLRSAEYILLAFPVYGSSPPEPVRRFVYGHKAEISGKNVIVVATQYMFSGDGAASLGRTVEKLGGKVIFAEHFDMPNNLSDCRIFRIRNGGELSPILAKAERKADRFVEKINSGKPFRRGFNPLSHAVGYYCQRKFWRLNENSKKSKLNIEPSKCVGCGICAGQCPVNNIFVKGGKAYPKGNCVFCYRCVNNCPKRAITLFGKSAPENQYKGIPR